MQNILSEGVTVNSPPFPSHDQLTHSEAHATKPIAQNRMSWPVEKAIACFTEFRILKFILSHLRHLADKLVRVRCAEMKVQSPLIKKVDWENQKRLSSSNQPASNTRVLFSNQPPTMSFPPLFSQQHRALFLLLLLLLWRAVTCSFLFLPMCILPELCSIGCLVSMRLFGSVHPVTQTITVKIVYVSTTRTRGTEILGCKFLLGNAPVVSIWCTMLIGLACLAK